MLFLTTYKSKQNFLGMWSLGLAFFVMNMRWWNSGICLEESQRRYSSRAEWIRKAVWLSVNHLTLLKDGPFWQVVNERKLAESLHGWTSDLWLNSDVEKEAHKWWKKTPWDYVDTILTCRVWVRKVKAHLELNRMRNVRNNGKDFYRYISRKKVLVKSSAFC